MFHCVIKFTKPRKMPRHHFYFTVCRYAFDGVPIYGFHGDGGVAPTDLDNCNGRVHPELG